MSIRLNNNIVSGSSQTTDNITEGSQIPLSSGGAFTALANKQNSLTAGENITIEGDTISAAGGGVPIGTVYPVMASSSYVPTGSLPCNGSEYSSSQFSAFFTNFLVGGRLNTCTYEEYQEDLSSYGSCIKFALDTTAGTFKVPTIKDGAYITQALSDSELGKAYNESLPNIYGRFGATGTGSTSDATFAFSKNTTSGRVSSGSAGTEQTIVFNASGSSSTYQDAAKVQGDNVRLRYFVQVASGSINQADMDWSQWAAGLALKADLTEVERLTNIEYNSSTKTLWIGPRS